MYNICEDTEENFALDLYEVFLFPIDDGYCKMKISRVMKISRQEGTCHFTRYSRYRELLANFSRFSFRVYPPMLHLRQQGVTFV